MTARRPGYDPGPISEGSPFSFPDWCSEGSPVLLVGMSGSFHGRTTGKMGIQSNRLLWVEVSFPRPAGMKGPVLLQPLLRDLHPLTEEGWEVAEVMSS